MRWFTGFNHQESNQEQVGRVRFQRRVPSSAAGLSPVTARCALCAQSRPTQYPRRANNNTNDGSLVLEPLEPERLFALHLFESELNE